jgi:SAM-dependent methyltransferase
MMNNVQIKKWSNFYNQLVSKDYPKYPNETILKLFFGSYLKQKPVCEKGMKILDVGCGFGQNFRPFLDKEMDCYGVEIEQGICDLTNEIYKSNGMVVDVRNGHNRSLPFNDGFFDYVISINAIHYESDETLMKDAIKEHARVLKKGGKFFLITVGPDHSIYKKAKCLGNHRYEIQDYDFRNGNIYFYFDNLKYLESYLKNDFSDIELGRITESYMQMPLDFLIAVATK